jgi:hypothetical protein
MKISRILAAPPGLVLASVTLAGLAACATAPVPQAPATTAMYAPAERANLFGCSALTDSAMIIAEMKRKGAPRDTAKGYFAGRPNADLTLATVDLVYDAHIVNVWDYATVFFGDCAAHVARVPATRAGPAGFCMLNSMIAATAQGSQAEGTPIDQVERYFAGFPGELPRAIIARAYAQPQSRAAAHAQAWNECMDRLG